jgi:hypothetical protein|tara:strand:- start:354 stop:923 length:570 start_codon:yes stop_codon:yes gene_type:complete
MAPPLPPAPHRTHSGPGPGSGGARPGAGRPFGSTLANGAKVSKPVREKAELLSIWRQKVGEHFEDIIQAQISAAQGVVHIQARDKSGRWSTVTDPEKMSECLNAGSEYYRLTAVSPNAPVLQQIMDRLFGSPKQSIDLEVQAPVDRLSDGELAHALTALLEKLKHPPGITVDAEAVEVVVPKVLTDSSV